VKILKSCTNNKPTVVGVGEYWFEYIYSVIQSAAQVLFSLYIIIYIIYVVQ